VSNTLRKQQAAEVGAKEKRGQILGQVRFWQNRQFWPPVIRLVLSVAGVTPNFSRSPRPTKSRLQPEPFLRFVPATLADRWGAPVVRPHEALPISRLSSTWFSRFTRFGCTSTGQWRQ